MVGVYQDKRKKNYDLLQNKGRSALSETYFQNGFNPVPNGQDCEYCGSEENRDYWQKELPGYGFLTIIKKQDRRGKRSADAVWQWVYGKNGKPLQVVEKDFTHKHRTNQSLVNETANEFRAWLAYHEDMAKDV